MIRTACILLAALSIAPVEFQAHAQVPDTMSVNRAVALLREKGSGSSATALLAQERRRLSAQELDALADSLVVIATSYRLGDPALKAQASSEAAVSLLSAARSQRGIPYPRAFEKLVQIFERSPDSSTKGATLWLMTQLPDVERAIEFLAEVAASRTSRAPTAVRHLAHDTGKAGLARLRSLYQSDAVVDPTAREHLTAIAFHHGWRR